MKDLDANRLRALAVIAESGLQMAQHLCDEIAATLNAVAEHLEAQQTGEDPLAGIKEVSDELQSLADEAERGKPVG